MSPKIEIMIKEDYCSFEISKLLKEKGFDGECMGCYWDSKQIFDINYEPLSYSDGDLRDEVILAPTHQMAMKWLREIHKISIDICTVQGKKVSYMFNIWDFANIYDNKYIGGTFDLREQLYNFNTYEEAVEAALKYCLTKLI